MMNFIHTATESVCVGCSYKPPTKTLKRASCGHFYCLQCISTMSKTTLKNRSAFPVRCCRIEFPQEWIEQALLKEEYTKYAQFKEELLQPNARAVDDTYKAVVKSAGWTLCPKCSVGIERIDGCDHVRCLICHTDFCYKCGSMLQKSLCDCNRHLYRDQMDYRFGS